MTLLPLTGTDVMYLNRPETAKIWCRVFLTFTSLLLQKSYRSFAPRDYSRQRTERQPSPGWAWARLASTVAEEEGRPGRRDRLASPLLGNCRGSCWRPPGLGRQQLQKTLPREIRRIRRIRIWPNISHLRLNIWNFQCKPTVRCWLAGFICSSPVETVREAIKNALNPPPHKPTDPGRDPPVWYDHDHRFNVFFVASLIGG